MGIRGKLLILAAGIAVPLVMVVAQLDGEMTVESKQGADTTFNLILPQRIADDEENEERAADISPLIGDFTHNKT